MKIPFYSNRKDAEPLSRSIDQTALRSGYDRAAVIRIASFLLEHIADEVSLGHAVSIPGFGMFAPWLNESRAVKASHPKPSFKPVFAPARGFREQVRASAPYSRRGKEAIARYRRNHAPSSGSTKASARVTSTMEAIRLSIDAQMGYSRDWPEPGDDIA